MVISSTPEKLELPVSVLMPVCNEADVIRHVIDEWHQEVFQYLAPGSELILDDCSSDGTEKILLQLSKTYHYIRINFSKKEGFFKAAKRLYSMARNPLVFFTDSDGQYVASEFWKIAKHINRYDIVHGVKTNRKDPIYRVLASEVFNQLFRLAFRSKNRDVNSAFRLMKKEVVDQILPSIVQMPTLLNAELLIRAEQSRYSIKNVEVMHRERQVGKSRGLPLSNFVKESLLALRGIVNLRRELFQQRKATVNSDPAVHSVRE